MTLDPDPLHVPDDERVPAHPRLVPDSRRGCSVWGYLAIVLLVGSSIAAPSGAPQSLRPEETPLRMSSPASEALRGAPQFVTGPVESYPGGRFQAATLGGAPLPAVASAAIPMPAQPASIGTAVFTASATWCAPTKTQCQSWGGDAHLAALPTFHDGDPTYLIRVCRETHCTLATVVSWCDCGVDLSPASFLELGVPLSRGRIAVTVEGPIAPLPATDTGGKP